MVSYIKSVQNLINEFRKLPGIGPKSARRIVFYLIKLPKDQIHKFSDALIELKEKIRFCKICNNISEQDICNICSDDSRNKSIMCIVEKVSDVLVIESTGEYKGLYHVLGGLLSPIDNIGPDDLRIPQILEKLKSYETKELIIALNPTVEGDSTSMYLIKLIKPLNINITRLASGIAVGGDIEYADEITLGRAITDRRTI
jgi:recombination protein RecR